MTLFFYLQAKTGAADKSTKQRAGKKAKSSNSSANASNTSVNPPMDTDDESKVPPMTYDEKIELSLKINKSNGDNLAKVSIPVDVLS